MPHGGSPRGPDRPRPFRHRPTEPAGNEVIVRQKLWDQGVRFGAGINQGKHLVLIDPCFSGLTARQILNRLLGNP
jgi:hypothetical protein